MRPGMTKVRHRVEHRHVLNLGSAAEIFLATAILRFVAASWATNATCVENTMTVRAARTWTESGGSVIPARRTTDIASAAACRAFITASAGSAALFRPSVRGIHHWDPMLGHEVDDALALSD
jgi:hypothetical protein